LDFALSVAAIALFGAAALSDLLHRRISNKLSAGLLLLGLVRVAMTVADGGGIWSAAVDLATATLVFALGALAFHLRALGGGDVKLLAAGALWLGIGELGAYLLTTVLAGGLLALAFLAWHVTMRYRRAAPPGPTLPYAVAIAAGGILTTAAALVA
jgi:prepilin peptidase CpaA